MTNPFEFDAAPNIDPRKMVQWFISNHNYSRFIGSTRNVVINGERGSGKSMMLMYYSMKYQRIREQEGLVSTDELKKEPVGIYIPCMNPLHQKHDYLLLHETLQSYYSEQVLVLAILSRIAKEMIDAGVVLQERNEESLKSLLSSLFDVPITSSYSAFFLLKKISREKVRDVQNIVRTRSFETQIDVFGDTFYDVVIPILEEMVTFPEIMSKHISLMFDDIQDLNVYQKKLINSWIGYRDNSLFSVKVAIAGIRHYDFSTNHGSALLEGHDYVVLDLQKPFQNKDSDFGKFLNKVIRKRLLGSGIDTSPADFFRVSPQFVRDIENAKSTAELQATERGLKKGTKAYGDYVYKRNRAIYFAKRANDTSNKPPYSGLETLQHLSTGVIRNFLHPAFYMYEKQLDEKDHKTPKFITPEIQREVILEHSDNLWKFLAEGVSRKVPHCSMDDQRRLSSLFESLGVYFRDRLTSDSAEPRVLVFIISDKDDPFWPELQHLLDIAESAQLLYTRTGTSKTGGGRETYYVPNRMLWPRYGLDVHGQHGRASLRVGDLWAAAVGGARIPFNEPRQPQPNSSQGYLFDE